MKRTYSLKVKPTISTYAYEARNGYKPAGKHLWCLKIEAKAHRVVHSLQTGKPVVYDLMYRDIFFAQTPHPMYLTAAKRWVKKFAANRAADLNLSNPHAKIVTMTCILQG